MKRCTKCGMEKPLDEFRKNSSNKDGSARWCRKCANEVTRVWRKANPEKIREQQRRWREANLEKAKENHKRWYAANTEKAREAARQWSKANPERHLKNVRQWDAANTEKRRTCVRKRYRKNRDLNYSKLCTIFGTACLDCRREYPMGIFDYHHLDPTTKNETLSVSIWRWEKVELYIQGCVQLCPTCHRLRHFAEREQLEAAKCS